jgi:hypothetical protein
MVEIDFSENVEAARPQTTHHFATIKTDELPLTLDRLYDILQFIKTGAPRIPGSASVVMHGLNISLYWQT